MDFTSSDPRCLRVAERLAKARRKMRELGIPTLLEGRPAWQKLNPMAAPQEPATVIPIKRRNK